MAKLDPSIQENLAIMMSKMAGERLPEYDSSQLSDIQSEIVKSRSSNIIVAAGAGSGKTRVLTERIKWLIKEEGVDPSSLVAITFANIAADEMRERLVNVPGIGDAFIGTIHSFANKIFANSGSEYEIYNDAKDNEFHKYLIEKYCNSLTMRKYLSYRDMQVLVDQGRMSESDLDDFLLPQEQYELYMIEGKHSKASKVFDPHANNRGSIMNLNNSDFPENIFSLMKKYNVITFDQLLKEATDYYKSLGTTVDYLMVDELQDIGKLEYKFIRALNASNNFFVGDDWQSIYGFKGANVNIFKNLMRDPKFKQYYLVDNYRNSKSVIDIATRVINQVDDKIEKSVVIKSESKGKVDIDSKHNSRRWFERLKNEGELKDWFILVRTNKELMRVLGELSYLGIPCSSFKKGDLTLAEMRLEMMSDTVKVLTVHTAKGLEAENVILIGNFPIKEAPYLKNPEERRVMYVGITRCKNHLIILN